MTELYRKSGGNPLAFDIIGFSYMIAVLALLWYNDSKNVKDILIWIVLIYIADLASMHTRDWWINRKKPRIQTCDFCHEPLKIFRTRDKQHWLCSDCRKAYYETKRRAKREQRRAEQEQRTAEESKE